MQEKKVKNKWVNGIWRNEKGKNNRVDNWCIKMRVGTN